MFLKNLLSILTQDIYDTGPTHHKKIIISIQIRLLNKARLEGFVLLTLFYNFCLSYEKRNKMHRKSHGHTINMCNMFVYVLRSSMCTQSCVRAFVRVPEQNIHQEHTVCKTRAILLYTSIKRHKAKIVLHQQLLSFKAH